MTVKTITVVIDENGNSTIDLSGFQDNSCARVADDFRGGDRVTKEHRKASYHQDAQSQEQQRTRR